LLCCCSLKSAMRPNPQGLFRERQSSRVSTLDNIVSPSFFHTAEVPPTSVRVCYVEQMNVEETANWVWTLGHHNGWEEAETYAANFREQCISGKLLSHLTHQMLELCLRILNVGHRECLLSAIRDLFQVPHSTVSNKDSKKWVFHPSVASSVYSCPNPSGTVLDQPYCCINIPMHLVPSSCSDAQSECVVKPSRFLSFCNQSDHGSATTCKTDMTESVQSDLTDMTCLSSPINRSPVWGRRESNGSNMYLENSGCSKFEKITDQNKCSTTSDKASPPSFEKKRHNRRRTGFSRKNRASNVKKLVLTFQPGQMPEEGDIDRIRSWFIEKDAAVEVQPMLWANSYTIIFQDANVAQDVLHKFRKMGYMMAKKFPPRPSPKSPIYYKTLESLIIRKGKAFSGPIMGSLEKGRTVLVNQIKGRRARLVKRSEGSDTKWVTWGWVSLRSAKGRPLITQVSE